MSSEPLLRVRNLSRAPIFHDVAFEIEAGQMLALVGPSGAGKSTLARAIARQETSTAGEVLLEGRTEWPLDRIQLIFQEPAASLNPRFTAAETIAEPLLIQRKGTREKRYEEATHWMQVVGLPPGGAGKRAHEFSGGRAAASRHRARARRRTQTADPGRISLRARLPCAGANYRSVAGASPSPATDMPPDLARCGANRPDSRSNRGDRVGPNWWNRARQTH